LIDKKVYSFGKIQKEELDLKKFKRFFNIHTMKITGLMILSNFEPLDGQKKNSIQSFMRFVKMRKASIVIL